MIPRLGVLWCAQWPVVAAGARLDEQVAVVHANRVVAHSPAAAGEGVAVGQRRRQAQACCPHIRLVAHDPAADASAFEAVVRAVTEMVPRLEITEPGTLTFLARGPARYYGGEQAMAERVLTVAAGALPGRAAAWGIGVADGWFAASLAARRSAAIHAPRPLLVPHGAAATTGYLGPWSVDVLASVAGLPGEFIDVLHRIGIHRLEQIESLPATDLLARFGWIGTHARALATGVDDRRPGVDDLPAELCAERVFEEPVHTADVLAFIGRQLADELTEQLAGAGRVCTRLIITAETDHGESCERVWYRSTGLSAAAMVERVRWQLDAWVQHGALTAGVTLLRLEPAEVRGDDGVQLGLWGGRTQADEWATRTVARLIALAGEQQVLVPAWRGGRQPHDVYRWVPAGTADLAEPAARLAPQPGPWPGRLPSPSPAVVHALPAEVEVLDADGRAVRVSGRGVVSAAPAMLSQRGAAEVVVAWAGPWPMDEWWWDPARARRVARFQLLTESGRLVVACLERQRWWLAAEYA